MKPVRLRDEGKPPSPLMRRRRFCMNDGVEGCESKENTDYQITAKPTELTMRQKYS